MDCVAALALDDFIEDFPRTTIVVVYLVQYDKK
jgi:hypothetical protein